MVAGCFFALPRPRPVYGRLADGVGAHRSASGHRRGVHRAGQHGRAGLYGGVAAQQVQGQEIPAALPALICVYVPRLVGGYVRGAHTPRPRRRTALLRLRLGRSHGAGHFRARRVFRLCGGRGQPVYGRHCAEPYGHTDVFGHRNAPAHFRGRVRNPDGVRIPVCQKD